MCCRLLCYAPSLHQALLNLWFADKKYTSCATDKLFLNTATAADCPPGDLECLQYVEDGVEVRARRPPTAARPPTAPSTPPAAFPPPHRTLGSRHPPSVTSPAAPVL